MDIIFDEAQPIYTQIMHGVLWDIATGALLPGDKLLSVRDFAKQAGTPIQTRFNAHMQSSRGWEWWKLKEVKELSSPRARK